MNNGALDMYLSCNTGQFLSRRRLRIRIMRIHQNNTQQNPAFQEIIQFFIKYKEIRKINRYPGCSAIPCIISEHNVTPATFLSFFSGQKSKLFLIQAFSGMPAAFLHLIY